MNRSNYLFSFLSIFIFISAPNLLLNGAENSKPTTTINFDKESFTKDISIEIKRILKEVGIPSISISVFKKDEILLNESWGYMNLKLKIPATPETIYSTGSCFKPITAMAILKLVDQGKLDLDAPIDAVLGEDAIGKFTKDSKAITARHLLSHYSGLPNTYELLPVWKRVLPKSLSEFTRSLNPEGEPEKEFLYSNAAYAVAGLLVEKASGQSYEEYIIENFFKPLGIEMDGFVHLTAKMTENLSIPYKIENDRPVPQDRHRFDVYPAGDIYMSAPEMAKLLTVHVNDGKFKGIQILKKSSVEEMRKPHFGGNSGLDFGIRKTKDELYLQHGGGVPGYNTKFLLEVESQTGVYLAANAKNCMVALDYLTQYILNRLRNKPQTQKLTREIVGLGTALAEDKKSDLIRIASIIPNSPASRSGLSAGTKIKSINDVSLEGKSLQESLKLMRGPKGTKIKLEVLEPSQVESRVVELTRGIVKLRNWIILPI